MTTQQTNAWLEAMPDAAQLRGENGEIIAQNERARGCKTAPKHLTRHDLGDGYHLETWKTASASEPDLRSLANGLAHTLRNPLSSIITAAELVKDDPNVEEESAMLLGIIDKEARQLNRILTDFLSYVRPQPAAPKTFDLANALRDETETLRRENVLPATVEIVDELPPTLPAVGNENAIRQSLRHVLKNASEAMGGHGTLHLSGESVQERQSVEQQNIQRQGVQRGRVHVEDSGPGFTQEGLARAFEPFYSISPECAGLGLSAALTSVERAGGCITIENVHAHEGEPRDDFEYSNATKSSEKPVRGARVCIELNAPEEAASHGENGAAREKIA